MTLVQIREGLPNHDMKSSDSEIILPHYLL